MGLLSFAKNVGAKIFGKKEAPTPEEAPTVEPLRAAALLKYVQDLGLPFNQIKVKTQGDKVTLEGEVKSQADAEKIALAVGNVEGVGEVDNLLVVAEPAPEAQFHTVEKGDTLWAISQKFYGNGAKYTVIFEANKPMLKSADLIYPGQVLRIPAL
jgi:nucleoid-associated protein YgaU